MFTGSEMLSAKCKVVIYLSISVKLVPKIYIVANYKKTQNR